MAETLLILIIDDNEDDREACRRALANSLIGVPKFIEAGNGELGLKYIEEYAPHCVLLDYSLPRYDGLNILKRLREKHPFVPVVMMTGQGNEAVAVTAMHLGAQNYITKSNESLSQVVQGAIEQCALQRRVHEQRAALDIFVRALAHDLKEPIRTIGSFVDLMEEHKHAPDRMERYFKHVRDASSRMSMLVDSVFHYTQLDAPETTSKEVCDMNQILSEVQENLRLLILERGAEVRPQRLPRVLANRVHMVQVLQNLIANAIRHSDKPSTIQVSAAAQNGQWLFSVQDNGPGIAPDALDKIFLPFKRLDRKEDGAGLGLAICQKIISLHSGKIWCASKPGDGATFSFTLPQSEQDSAAMPDAAPAEKHDHSGTSDALANVLLVDDREADIELMKIMLLERAHVQCNLVVAYNGQEALQVLRTNAIDLILLDINMPIMDGFELLELIRADTQLDQVSVMMCSGSTYVKDKERALNLGATGYLDKPASIDQLKSAIAATSNLKLHSEPKGYQLLRQLN